MTEPSHRIRALDGLRGLCALIVLLHHARTLFAGLGRELAAHAPGLDALLAAIARRNTEAVIAFFVLSGFSIRLSVERRGLADVASVRDYAERRARRILPLYWLSLALSAAVAITLAQVPEKLLSLRTLVGNLLFLQTAHGVPGQWFSPYAANGALWSLSFEVFFYAGYPLLVRGIASSRGRALCVLALAALGYGLGFVAPSPLALFLSASLTWYFGVELCERWLRGRSGLPLAAHAGLFCVLCALRASEHGRWFHGALVGSGFFLLGSLIVRLASPTSAAATALPARALAAADGLLARLGSLGDASYALYVLHVPVLRAFVALTGHGLASCALAIAASLAMAFFAERWARGWLAPALTYRSARAAPARPAC